MFGIKKYVLLFLLGNITLLMPSCTKNIDEPFTTLEISKKDIIQVGSEGGEYVVSITTNASKWVAISANPWAVTKVDKNTLHIKVNPNETTDDRRTRIQINASETTQELVIEQEGKAVLLETESLIVFGQFGGKKRFYLEASSNDWTAVSTSPWVSVSQRTAQGEIVISAIETTDRDDRNANVEFKDKNGKVISSINVIQTGILYYFLPYMGYGANTGMVKNFENERYSVAPLPPAPNPSGTIWYFETVSPVFPLIRYTFNGGRYTSAILYTKNRSSEPLEGENRKEIIDFLKQNGYKEYGDADSYFNEDNNNEVKIIANSVNPNLSFKFIPPQKEDYPTFEMLPVGNTNFYRSHKDKGKIIVDNVGDDADKIMKYEQSKGWKFIPPYNPNDAENQNDNFIEAERKRDEYSRKIRVPLYFGAKGEENFRYFYEYLVFEKDGQYKAYRLDRLYETYINNYVDKDDDMYGEESIRVSGTGMSVTWQSFEDVSKFLYFENDVPYITKEFRQLLTKEGYVYNNYLEIERTFVYVNAEKKLELSFKVDKTLVDGDNKPRVVIMRIVPRDPKAKY